MIRTFTYRLLVTAKEHRHLSEMLETHRHLYNQCLDDKEMAYQTTGVHVSYYDYSRWFTFQRRNNPYWHKLNVHSARTTIKRADSAYRRFASNPAGVGRPRFKSRKRFSTFAFSSESGCKLVGSKLYVGGVGNIRMKLHRPVMGTPKQYLLTVRAGKWYVSIQSEAAFVHCAPAKKEMTGIDLGISSFAILASGERIENPKISRSIKSQLRVAHRTVSRRKKGSRRRAAAVARLSSVYRKASNARKDFHHKTSRKLIERFGFIAVEKLAIANLVKNSRLSSAIADAGWAGFVRMLQYKAESAGVVVVAVDPRFSSQECPGCGDIKKKELSDRIHLCQCGCCLDRDHAAAMIILKRGLDRAGPAARKFRDSGIALKRQ